MSNVKIKRFTNHPRNYQGAIRIEDGRWQLVIDENSNPNLFLRVYVDGEPGWVHVDDLLPDGVTCAAVIDSHAEDVVPPDDVAAALADRAPSPVCPV